VRLRVVVRDSAFARRAGATVSATVSGPAGERPLVPFDAAGEREGEYVASFVPETTGLYEVRVRAVQGRDTVRASPRAVHVAVSDAEAFGVERGDALLEALARETGGKTYTPERALDVARDLVYSRAGATSVRRLDLWDAPLVLLLLLATLGAEWVLRRRRGLA
jgi:hypothetical protein